jgi:hypothetical protein
MDAIHWHRAAWQFMVHGRASLQLLHESGNAHRTGGFENTQLSSANWAMLMARHPAGQARLGLRLMLTAEPWTVGHCGFINHLASGEMCQGDTIHDRQHPHDTFMEVAADYDRPLRGKIRLQLYGGLSGEPALGPVGFPHRSSAALNPMAPITHHWLDSTHVAFGLVTGGVYGGRWKVESTVFNAREPDDHRTNIEFAPLDSISARVSVMASPRWTAQVSAGLLHAAEQQFAPQPRTDVNRATASVAYFRRDSPGRSWAATIAYGVNGGDEVIPGDILFLVTHAALAEGSVTLRDRHSFFGRLEAAGKPGEDLHVHEAPARIFTVGKVEGGYVRHFARRHGLDAGIGGVGSANFVPDALASRYGGNVSWGVGAFVVIGTSARSLEGMQHVHE